LSKRKLNKEKRKKEKNRTDIIHKNLKLIRAKLLNSSN